MHNGTQKSRTTRLGMACGLLVACTAFTGCQLDIAGQTLPSAHYLQDDVQYFAPGPEFKLSREAAAQKEAAEANQASRGGGTGGGFGGGAAGSGSR